MTAFWLWNAWRGFRGYIIPGTLQLFVLRFRMMLQVRDLCFLRSCFTLPRRHVSESLSSLDYTAFNETRVRFLFTRASAIQKIHSSLLYNHFNRKKNDHFNRYRTFFVFFFLLLAFTLKTIQGHNTRRNTVIRLLCELLFSFQTIADRCRQSRSSVLWRSLPKP